MGTKKPRTDAQRAADARYAAKNKEKQKTIGFRFNAAEAEEIEKVIAATGLSKVDFLREAVVYFETLKKG
jgi:hypothetical protein